MSTLDGKHSVVFDHTECEHAEEHNSDPGHTCSPTATWICTAAPTDYCRYGCEVCGENGGWDKGDVPGECSQGHELASHHCWVLDWLEAQELQYSYADAEELPPLWVYRDGPISVEEWDEDYLLWVYVEPVKS